MNLKERYKDDYILLACLRQYVERGTMLASVNFWRDSLQNYREFSAVEHPGGAMTSAMFSNNDFTPAFACEKFPEIDDPIPDNIIDVVIPIIEEKEGVHIGYNIRKYLLELAIYIAKASKEDWLSFVGIKDNISDNEEVFIEKLRQRLHLENDQKEF